MLWKEGVENSPSIFISNWRVEEVTFFLGSILFLSLDFYNPPINKEVTVERKYRRTNPSYRVAALILALYVYQIHAKKAAIRMLKFRGSRF